MESSSTTISQETISPRGAAQIARTLSYYASFVVLGLVSAVLGPTLPGLADHTHSALSGISFLFTARAFGYLLGSFISGRLYDRMPGHRTMSFFIVLMALLMA